MTEPQPGPSHSRRRLLAIVLPIALVIGVAGIATALRSRSAEPGFKCTIDYYKLSDMRELMRYSSAALEIRVTGLDDPVNRDDNECSIFTPVHATILNQLAGDPVPQTFTFMTSGDASVVRVDTSDPAALSGGYIQGENYIVTLAPTDSWPQGPTLQARLEGNWHIVGNQAIGADGRFTGTVEGVESAIRRNENLIGNGLAA
jgi:hypothetical protein